MRRLRKKKTYVKSVVTLLLGVLFISLLLTGCTPTYREFIDDGVVTKSGFSATEETGSLESAPIGTWYADLPFYKLGFKQISDLRIGDLAGEIDNISDNVGVELVFEENGGFYCLADREAVLSACSKFGAGFLDILSDASVETMAKMKNMSVGDFENVLSSHGKTKEDFAVEVSESLMKFVDKKTALFEGYEDYGIDGLCVVYKGFYAVRGGRIYLGRTKASVYDDGSIIAELNGSRLFISVDTDLHFFNDCEFERID